LRDEAGVIVGASKIARDITDRKKAEAALAERTMQLAVAGKVALVGSFAYDVDTEILQITPGYAASTGSQMEPPKLHATNGRHVYTPRTA